MGLGQRSDAPPHFGTHGSSRSSSPRSTSGPKTRSEKPQPQHVRLALMVLKYPAQQKHQLGSP